MSLMQGRWKKYKRDWLVTQVIRNGRMIDHLTVASQINLDDAEVEHELIVRQRRQERLLTKLKESA